MICLKRLYAINFLSYKELDLDFQDRGLVLIQGQNTAGKSSIPSAITWNLFGRTVKGLGGDDVVNWDINQDCFVEVAMEQKSHSTRSITVRRWRLDSDRGNDIEIEIDGSIVSGRQREIQEVINETLQTDFKTFINSVLFSSGMVKYLAEETDKGQREIFKRFLNLQEYDKAAETASIKILELETSANTVYQTLNSVKEKKEVLLETFENCKKWYKEYEENREAKIAILEQEIQSFDKPIPPKLEEHNVDMGNLSKTITHLLDDKNSSQMDWATMHGRLEQWGEDYKNLQVLEGTCPLCKQSINRDTVGRHLTELKDRIRTEFERSELLRNRISEIDSDIQQHVTEQTRVQEMEQRNRTVLEAYSGSYSLYETNKTNMATRIKELKNPENPYKKSLDEAKISLTKLPDVSHLESQFQELHEAILYTEFIKNLFKPKGIQSYIIEHSFDELNNKTNTYLRDLSNGELSMEFVPQRKLKTGEFKEEITITFLKQGRKITYEHLTDAERASTNIAIIFALHAFASYQGISSFDFMFLDEILDLSLDAIRSENLTSLLATLSKDSGNIFVISHRQEIMSTFSNVWKVILENGESKIEE